MQYSVADVSHYGNRPWAIRRVFRWPLRYSGGGLGSRTEGGSVRLRRRRGSAGARFLDLMFEGCADEGSEKRVRFQRLGLEFGVKLATEEPGMIGSFHNFDVILI